MTPWDPNEDGRPLTFWQAAFTYSLMATWSAGAATVIWMGGQYGW